MAGDRATYETLAVQREDGVLVLSLARPEHLNTMNLTMRRELADCLAAVRADSSVCALVITGEGDAFSAGGDVNDFVERDVEQMQRLIRDVSHRWFRALWDLPIATIAAVNGVAAGGGSSLLLACDFVLASEDARIGQTFTRVGLMPDLGGLFMLPRTLGLHRAKALALTGDLITAAEAHANGLVYEVTAPNGLMPRALELARRLADGPQDAYAATKSLLNRSFEQSMEEMLHVELFAQSFLFATNDHRERLGSFLGSDDDGREKER